MPRSFSSSAPVVTGLGFGVAVGVALGAFALGPVVSGSVGTDETEAAVRDEYRRSVQDNQINSAQLKSADEVLAELAPGTVADTLAQRPVLLISTSNATEHEVASIQSLLEAAGAINAGRIDLADRFFDKEEADKLSALIANSLPAGASLSTKNVGVGMHAGQALGYGLFRDPETTDPLATVEERATLLQTLKKKDFIKYEDETVLPAQAIVVVDGRTDGEGTSGFKAEQLAQMLTGLNEVGENTVLAARIESAAEMGSIGRLRADKDNEVSTVDSINHVWARIATVLAVREQLDGRSGAYGADTSAKAPMPTVKE
ncbi:hypothetical protein CPHO_06340 [Corynebacterium phocae]|uniref:Copper transporter n=1 Tax=Corynebacterium phocae TaxID=161895 RepID=A0A1L7D3B4_9CORY|nr:copper transporter [Corynebacterium phocae]APT92573.1 hypothetical protein CPHO_06340 [Corynebacterium phocae]KAA8725173.1 copper transporter [Corynebacterium phocae]